MTVIQHYYDTLVALTDCKSAIVMTITKCFMHVQEPQS